MYYNILLESEPRIIGVRNGIYQVELDKKAYDKETYKQLEQAFITNKFTPEQTIPDVDFKFYFKKLKSAKKTSFMSFTPNLNHGRFLINKKVQDLFESFNIQKYKNFETVIYDSPKENLDEGYKLFYCVLQDWNVIDFEKTVLTSGGIGNIPLIEHRFKNVDEFSSYNKITHVKTLSLSKDFDISLDLFLTRLGGMFVSERLKKALESDTYTGIRFSNKIQVLT